MKEVLIERAKQAALKAKRSGNNNVKVTLTSGGEDSLSKAITTPEQAKLFMTILKSL